MKQNGLPTSFCFAWRSTDSDRLNVSLFMLSPLGTGAKLLISYERSKEKAQRRCRISFFSSDIAAVFNLMKQQKIELLAGTLGKPEDDAPSTNNSITAVNLL
jgi:hypothetical protein